MRPRCVGTSQENLSAQAGRQSRILFTFWRVGCIGPIHKKPEEREFVVDSGASMHMDGQQKDLNEAELETARVSKNPMVAMTANREVLAKEEATVYVRELDLFVQVMLLEKIHRKFSHLENSANNLGVVTIGPVVNNHISSRKARNGASRYLLFAHQTGWSPERLSTFFYFLYELWSNWLSYFSLRSPFFLSARSTQCWQKILVPWWNSCWNSSHRHEEWFVCSATKIFPDKLSVLQSVEQNWWCRCESRVCLTSESRMSVPRCNTLQTTASATTMLHVSQPRKRELHRVFPRPCPRISSMVLKR